MTLKASLYDQLTREELIRLLEARDNEPDNAEIYISSETPTIKRIISEVLAILFNEENKPIEKAMNLLLDYFNADWGYVAIFEEDGFSANFTCEVMSSWVKIHKDDRNKLTCDTIPWIIDTVKAGHDIVLGDIAGLPAEADIDKILLTKQQLKSMLIVPLTFHNKVQGFIGFDSIEPFLDCFGSGRHAYHCWYFLHNNRTLANQLQPGGIEKTYLQAEYKVSAVFQ